VYKRFRSKEDLLMGVLNQELHDLRTQLADSPVCGPSPLARAIAFFGFLTEFLCRRPNLGRAVVRSAASGEKAMSERLASFHAKLFALSFSALQAGPGREPTAAEAVMLSALQQVWFSALCGWAGDLYERAEVVRQVAAAASLMTHGLDLMPETNASAPAPLRVRVIGEGRAPPRVGEAVEFVTGPGALAELLAGDGFDVLHVEGAIDAAAIAGAPVWNGAGRATIIVLTGDDDAAVGQRLTGHVDVVIRAGGLSAGAQETFTAALYVALARGVSVQDAYDEAREALVAPVEPTQIELATRPGADLRALSLR